MVGYGTFAGLPAHPTLKGSATTAYDVPPAAVNANNFVTQVYAAGENFAEPGDSGGPGFVASAALPARAYPTGWDLRGRNLFLVSDVQGYSIRPPLAAGQYDTLIRIDDTLATLNMTLNQITGVTITHNLPTDPSTLPAGAPIGVLIEVTFANAGQPYIFYPRLFEEDDELLTPFYFDGDVALRPTPFLDDLGGIGWGAGILPGGVNKVFAWDFTTAGALVAYDEALNLLDPPLDWLLDLNYQSAIQQDLTTGVLPMGFPAVQAAIAAAQAQIMSGNAVRGPFAMVPEPSAGMILTCIGVILLGLRRFGRG
jgi:hypothetical protein